MNLDAKAGFPPCLRCRAERASSLGVSDRHVRRVTESELGAYPDTGGVLQAHRQGRMEAIAQLGAYTLCLAALVGSVPGLVRSIRQAW